MKISELSGEIIVAAINAARDISVAKIGSLGKEYNQKHNFFKAELDRVLEAILENAEKGTE